MTILWSVYLVINILWQPDTMTSLVGFLLIMLYSVLFRPQRT